jgi:hypothetical protein
MGFDIIRFYFPSAFTPKDVNERLIKTFIKYQAFSFSSLIINKKLSCHNIGVQPLVIYTHHFLYN